jgi:hypothetical protein
MSNRASPSPATLKSSCASADVGLIDGTVELVMKVRCDDRTHEDLIGMLTEPTHCGLWITWRGLQCEAALGLVHPEETTLQTVVGGTRKIRNTTLTQVTVINTFNSTVRAQRDCNSPCK